MGLNVMQLRITARMKGSRTNTIVENVCLSVEAGKRLAVVGQSGSGKTMTAMAILGLLPDNCTSAGQILWNGADLSALDSKKRRGYLGTEFALIPQSGADFLNPSLKISTQFNEVLQRAGIHRSQRKSIMHHLLKQAGFVDSELILHSYPFQLSGGMSQRVVMAMAAAASPSLIIADEPTRGIDQENIKIFLENLDTLFSSSAILLITHDISVAAVCDEILVMKNGHVIESAPANKLIHDPKENYTRQLLCHLPQDFSYIERRVLHNA